MKKVHFVGIGGIGTSALARCFLQMGLVVSGSDCADSDLLQELENEGIKIFPQHNAANVPVDCDLVIFSAAVETSNPELRLAHERNLNVKNYFQALGEMSRKFLTVAVAGTHGKSTTTAMTALALEKASADPTVFVGAKVPQWGGKNFRAGGSKILVVEACEHFSHFLHFAPQVLVLTNVDFDHRDFFKTQENYFQAFSELIAKSQIVVADFSNENVQRVTRDFSGEKVDTSPLLKKVPSLQVPGEHNRENASRVLGVFQALNLPVEKAAASLQEFAGTKRRFEFLGERSGVKVFDDYAHHPAEIQATLKAARGQFPQEKIWAIFQPHMFSRTGDFLAEFSSSFRLANEVLIPNIFPARERAKDFPGISAQVLAGKIAKSGTVSRSTGGFAGTLQILRDETASGDILLFLGAGDIWRVARDFLES